MRFNFQTYRGGKIQYFKNACAVMLRLKGFNKKISLTISVRNLEEF